MQSTLLPDLSKSAEICAPQLLGCYLEREINDKKLVGKIVETEAYTQHDAASHSFKGQTPRTEVMFGSAGCLYVYFTYGIHYCCNIVTGKIGEGSAVLIRALEPVDGHEIMATNRRRRLANTHELTNGPAKLCQALMIDKQLNGHDLQHVPLRLLPGEPVPRQGIATTTRIGIKNDTHRLWRFYIAGNPYVSTS